MACLTKPATRVMDSSRFNNFVFLKLFLLNCMIKKNAHKIEYQSNIKMFVMRETYRKKIEIIYDVQFKVNQMLKDEI